MARRYVVVPTDKNVKGFILRELEQGRLRQGWGYRDEYDLRLLRKRVDAGDVLDDEEAAAWRNRRLLDTEPDGLKPWDVVVLPNLPEQGTWVLARSRGRIAMPSPGNRSLVAPTMATSSTCRRSVMHAARSP